MKFYRVEFMLNGVREWTVVASDTLAQAAKMVCAYTKAHYQNCTYKLVKAFAVYL